MALQNDQPPAAPAADAALLLQSLLEAPLVSSMGCADEADQAQSSVEEDDLLQRLLAEPLADDLPLQPAEAHTSDRLPQGAEWGVLRHDQLDRALAVAQRGLVGVSVLALGTWATIGPVGNWVYAHSTPSPSSAVARQPTVALPKAVQRLASAPSTPAAQWVLKAASPRPQPASDASLYGQMITSQDDLLAPGRMRPVAVGNDQRSEPSRLVLPTIGVDTPVVEVFFVDGEWEVARYAAGYLDGSGLPGEANNTVLAGHAGLFGAVFAKLHTLKVNDDVYVDAAGWRYHYRVRQSLVVWPSETEYLLATDVPRLTLITCTNWDTQRVVVVADLVEARPL